VLLDFLVQRLRKSSTASGIKSFQPTFGMARENPDPPQRRCAEAMSGVMGTRSSPLRIQLGSSTGTGTPMEREGTWKPVRAGGGQ